MAKKKAKKLKKKPLEKRKKRSTSGDVNQAVFRIVRGATKS
jgi:hypothetical protein